jgi:hypothetical protein
MLVSSPDERHWGGSSFIKYREQLTWTFKYFPIWDFEEINLSRAFFSRETGTELTADEVVERFREFGGVPGNIFMGVLDEWRQIQDMAINVLTEGQVKKIANRRMNAVGTFASHQPKSAIIGYAAEKGDTTFSQQKVVPISPLVAEKVYGEFICDLWETMVSGNLYEASSVFETYCRVLMAGRPQTFQRRRCVKRWGRGKNIRPVSLGGCSEIRMVTDIVEAAMEHPQVVFIRLIQDILFMTLCIVEVRYIMHFKQRLAQNTARHRRRT